MIDIEKRLEGALASATSLDNWHKYGEGYSGLRSDVEALLRDLRREPEPAPAVVPEPEIKTFRLYWRDGTTETGQGASIAALLTALGYGHGAAEVLDFFTNGEEQTYEWNAALKGWNLKGMS